MHLVLALMKSWWLTTWRRKHISGVTWDSVKITLNHFCVILISLYINCGWFIYLNTFKIDIIQFTFTSYVISFSRSQIIFLLLILKTISQFSIILTLISFSYTIFNRCQVFVCQTRQLPPIIWSVSWRWLRSSEPWTDITLWIWGHPSIFFPDFFSLCFYCLWNLWFSSYIMVVEGYFLVAVCFSLILWLTFWWWVLIVGMSLERLAPLSSLLYQVLLLLLPLLLFFLLLLLPSVAFFLKKCWKFFTR